MKMKEVHSSLAFRPSQKKYYRLINKEFEMFDERVNRKDAPNYSRSAFVIVMLVGLYVACQLIADIGATKFVEIAGVTMPAGTFVFALTFTLRDLIHKRLGKKWANAAIITAAASNILLSGYLWVMSLLPAPVWFGLADSWNMIFAIVPAITIGSIVAELVSETIDTEVYHWCKTKAGMPQWARVVVSNFVSIPADTVVFSALAFSLLPALFGAEAMPLGAAVARVFSGQVIFKAAVTLVSLPSIYLVKEHTP